LRDALWNERPRIRRGSDPTPPRHRVRTALLRTRRGYEVFRDFEHNTSSSNDPSLPNYYVQVGSALVHLSYVHWKRGANGMMEFRAHEFAPGELEAIFDSLQDARREDLVRLPGLNFDAEGD